MDARRVSDAAEFLGAATPLLLEDEARNNLILGIAGTLRDRPAYYPEFRLWLVQDASRLVAAALQTPPFNLVLAQPADARAVTALADAIAAEGLDLPGVVGATPEVDVFAAAWETRARRTRRLRRAERIYRLTELLPRKDAPGRARVATAEDRDLLVAWIEAFTEEALGETSSPALDTERVVEGRFADARSGFLLWEDDGPVSLAGWGGQTPNGIRIGPVYTPPERRSRGYGSAVTAAVSSRQLTAGRRFCFLYTDLANPTSNRIYMDIGYEPVCDAVNYVFESI